jgi:YD repeat-containing protein
MNRNKSMRKSLGVLFLVLISLYYKGQDNSIASSVLTPVSYQTGVPDISFPVASLQATKDFTLNFGLVYNANSYLPGEFSGQLGRNWMLSGSNFSVTRRIVGGIPDEYNNNNWGEEDWDDIYYYNLNGEQGSFKFQKPATFPNGVYNVIKLTPSNVVIEHKREDGPYSWSTRHIQSFTITDSKGYKYYFQDFDNVKYDGYNYARNTFYVTKITDPSGRTIATFQNKKYSGNGQIYIPENIITDYGKISIEHGSESDYSSWNFHDQFYIKSFTVKDHQDHFITKYVLENSNSTYMYLGIDDPVNVRFLNKIKKLDKNSNAIEVTRFQYASSALSDYPTWENPVPLGVYQKDNFLMHGLLSSVQLPSGGKIEYKYGKHTLKLIPPIDYNDPEHIAEITDALHDGYDPFNYKKLTDSIPFDTKINTSKQYNLTKLQKSPQSKIYIYFYKKEIYQGGLNENEPLVPIPDKLAYRVKYTTNGTTYSGNEIEDQSSPIGHTVPSDGSAYLEITGAGNGRFYIYEKFWKDPPYTVVNNEVSNCGVRIEEIKYFDHKYGYYDSEELKKTISFDYDLFNENGVSSGVKVYDEDRESVIYKNVKVTESDQQGYTKYYFKMPGDFPSYYPSATNPNKVWNPFYNFSKKGILSRKEIYDVNNAKKTSAHIDYTYPPYDTMVEFEENYMPIKMQTEETSYDSSGKSLTAISERTFNEDNMNLLSEKRTSPDGSVSETNYQYAAEKSNTKLLGANMFSIPLEVTKKLNGTEIGKIETFFDHAGNYFPSSVKTFGVNGVVTDEEKNDIYDTMGNVLQSTSKSGVTTAYIYGYGGTRLIAKIEGATYEQVMSAFGLPAGTESYKNLIIYTYSNNGQDIALEMELINFRSKNEFKNFQITTYTHYPLIGIRSITSPSGVREYYYYDDANRLKEVRDANGNVLKKYQYQHTSSY